MSQNSEFGDIAFDLPKNQSNVIKVIGVGGGGSNAINHMFQQGIKGVDFVICNTDAQALQNSGVPNKIQLGVNLTEGLGAGANPEVGEQAAIESLEDIKRMLETNTKMVFITAGMGGGTGTGAAPIIAKLATELDILTVGIVTMPFQFEGRMRNDQAQIGVENLRQHVDSLIVINNNKLREVYGNLGFKAGFSKADEVLATASRGIAEVITHHYTQNIDLRDAKTVLSNSGTAIMGSASASGESRAQDAIIKALDSPLLNDNKITGAKNVLLLIVSGTDEITLDEIGEINDHIQVEAGHGANIIMGVGEDTTLGESISVTIIATGFNIDQQKEISHTEAKKVIHTLGEDITEYKPSETKSVKASISEDIPQKQEIIKHTLIEDDVVEKQDDDKDVMDLIPTTELIRNINVIYQNVLDTDTTQKDNNIEDDFIINTLETVTNEDASDKEQTDDSEEQITLTFDLPLEQTQSIETTDENAILFQLDDDVKDIEVNEPVEIISATSMDDDGEKRYILDDTETFESTINVKKDATETKEEIIFEKKVVPVNEEEPLDLKTEVDPLNSPISDLMKARADERRKTMKEFNYKFNNAKIDEIEKEPAYKRQGVDLDESQHSSETNASRLSVSTDDNNEIQLRKGNSFLHDNVD